MPEMAQGLANLKFFDIFEDIISSENVPIVNKSIALLSISNLQTLNIPGTLNIGLDTQEFAM